MRLTDLIDALVEEPSSVRDETRSGFSIDGLVGTSPIRADGDVVIVDAGESVAYPSLSETLSHLATLATGSPVVLLLESPLERMPAVELNAWACETGASIAEAAPLRYRWFQAGVAITTGTGTPSTPTEQADNELALFQPVMRALLQENARLRHRAVMTDRRLLQQEKGESDDDAELRAQLAAQNDLLKGKQSEVDAQMARVNELTADVERLTVEAARAQYETDKALRSTSYQLGNTLRRAARPGKRTLTLPRDLYRLYSGRGGWVNERFVAPKIEHLAKTEGGGTRAPEERLYAAFRRLPTQSASVIALIGTNDTAAQLDAAAETVTLWPNDATLLIDRCEPDVVLIEARAALPGSVWFGLGRAGGADRDLTARSVLDRARERGIPSVFWWNSPTSAAPAMTRIAALADHVVSDRSIRGVPEALDFALGPDLARFQPPDPSERDRSAPPIGVRVNQGSNPIETLLGDDGELFSDLGAGSSSLPNFIWADSPDRFARAAWGLALGKTAPSTRDLELAASGAALIDPTGLLPGPTTRITRPADLPAAVAAHDAESLDPSTVRDLLGELAIDWSTAHRLEVLFEQVGLELRSRIPTQLGAVIDTPERSDDAVNLILSQGRPFAEVTIPDATIRDRHAPELTAAGIDVSAHPNLPSVVLLGTETGQSLSSHLLALAAWAQGAPVNDEAGRPLLLGNSDPARRAPWWAEGIRS